MAATLSKDLIRYSDAARLAGVDRSRISQLVADGTLRAETVLGVLVVSRRAVLRWAAQPKPHGGRPRGG